MDTPIRVLVIDDDPSVRISLAAYFEDEGFAVRSTGSATEALQILADEAVDVTIVDLRLGETDGETFILRAREIRPATRFLIHTGSLGYQLPASLASAGMMQSDVFFKPVRALTVFAEQILRVADKERQHNGR